MTKRFVLVDGNALLHRAYHATPPLTSPQGELVNAVYGLTSMLLKALSDLKPDFVAVTWDKKAPTFRHVQFEGYKATRVKTDDALLAQYNIVDRVLKSMDIPQFGLPGFEADDLIGALAKQASSKDIETIILTGDRDLMQLISSKVKVLMPKKTLSDVGLYGEEEFAIKYGFKPINMIDYKSLAGDSSDNIPGVPGIGEVTATKLIQEYATLEEIFKNLDKLPERTKKLLEAGKDSGFMSKKLATIETEVPIKLDLEQSKIHQFDKEVAKGVFEELGFKSLIKRIPGIETVILNVPPVTLNKVKGITKLDPSLIAQDDNDKTDSVKNQNKATTDLDTQVDKVLKKMSAAGVLVDLDFLSKFGRLLKSKLTDLEQDIYSKVGHQININSPKQLQVVLFEELKLPAGKKTKTGYSTDEGTLRELYEVNPIIPLLLEYRTLYKLVSTYVDALPKYADENCRIHSTFHVEGAATGRLSSSDPNLQNIPVRGQQGGEIRKAFIAPKGKILLAADYSQIELRIMAHLSEDPALIAAFKSGEDIHAATAAKIFKAPIDNVTKEQRAVGKTMNFATLYGQGAHALAQQLKIDYVTAKSYIDEYFEQFPKIKVWMNKTLEEARDKGYVETVSGRKRYFPELQAQNHMMRSFGERAAINHPVQGTAADMIKKAMVEIDKELSVVSRQSSDSLKADRPKADTESCRLILQIHDELLFECDNVSVKKIALMVKEKMENALKLSVPVVVDLKTGSNWGEMQPLVLTA
ncbi:MAG: DNA polymerase I [Microgenomates group bacterium]|jgi:DNA polymerase I-like protein with 3'-5' exonuclease and polymerase domains/5'-3' exonuclease